MMDTILFTTVPMLLRKNDGTIGLYSVGRAEDATTCCYYYMREEDITRDKGIFTSVDNKTLREAFSHPAILSVDQLSKIMLDLPVKQSYT